MFDDERFDKYQFNEVPLDRDIFMMDEKFIEQFERSLLTLFDGGEYEHVGYITHVAARSTSESALELSWFANVQTRFHEIAISLPHDQFVACIGYRNYDIKPHIFVRSLWLQDLFVRSYSVFALVDAIGVKEALETGRITRSKLLELRGKIDSLANQHQDISFISFADSLLLKSNWQVGYTTDDKPNTYRPELFIRIVDEIQSIYFQTLGLDVYAVLTQGDNAYYDDPLLHISDSKNHISLNSLGIPFAQLMDIDKTARSAIKAKIHPPSELYMDDSYFHSLRFEYSFNKHTNPKNKYRSKTMGYCSQYFYSSRKEIRRHLKPERD